MKTAAAYIRVSDERQEEFSPDSQLKLIREYCRKNDIELPDELIFCDEGISAKTAEKRKRFNDMIALAKLKDRPFDLILVWKFSRFARNQEESIVYKSLLRRNGVEVVSISEPLSDNPFGGLIERIIEWMDEYYLIRLSDEVRRGMTERATRGLPNAAPPLGYRMVNGAYEIDEDEAETVRRIYRMFAGGEKIRRIVEVLGAENVRTRHGNPIDNRGVEYILNNPAYIGYLRWNPHGRSASARSFNNPEDILEKGAHTPIIDKELYNRVQELLRLRAEAKQKYMRVDENQVSHSLKGLVKCSACGSTLTYNRRANGLQCHKYAKGICQSSHFISMSKIEGMVIEALRAAANSLSFSIEGSERQQAGLTKDYDKLIKRQELKLERAREAYQEGADSLAEYKAAKEKILQRIEEYRREQSRALTSAESVDVREYADTVLNAVRMLEDPELAPELKNQILRTILQKIVYVKEEGKIELFFNM